MRGTWEGGGQTWAPLQTRWDSVPITLHQDGGTTRGARRVATQGTVASLNFECLPDYLRVIGRENSHKDLGQSSFWGLGLCPRWWCETRHVWGLEMIDRAPVVVNRSPGLYPSCITLCLKPPWVLTATLLQQRVSLAVTIIF